MERKDLRETLERLHAELEAAGPIDAELRADLERALDEIGDAMERGRRPEHADGSLVERLEGLALRFETSYPVLSETIASVMSALSTMGI